MLRREDTTDQPRLRVETLRSVADADVSKIFPAMRKTGIDTELRP